MKEINDLLIREIFLKPTIFSVILVLGAIVLIVTLIRYKFMVLLLITHIRRKI